MRRLPELRPNGWDALAALAVILLAAACALTAWERGGETEQLTAVVSVDGVEVERIDLNDGACAGERIYSGSGYTLTAEFRPEGVRGVRIEEADCPTQDCVHTGTITRSGQSIVCLPARIIIQLEGGPVDEDAPDIVIG